MPKMRARSPAVRDASYARRRFGLVMSLPAYVLLDVRQMRKIEDLLLSSDRAIMAFKDGHLKAVGSIAVAAAIVAQLSSTTLQMPGISSINWSASGLIITALTFALFTIVLSAVQQSVLGTLTDAVGVRMWLSNGRFYPPYHRCRPAYDRDGREQGRPSTSSSPHHHLPPSSSPPPPGATIVTGLSGPARRGERRLQISVPALLLLKLPQAFLSAAVVCFLAGFATYLGLAWKLGLQDTPAKDNNKAVFLLFVGVAAVAVAGGMGPSLWKMWELGWAETRWEREEGKAKNDYNRVWAKRYRDEESEGESDESRDSGDSSVMLKQSGKVGSANDPISEGHSSRHDELANTLEEAARAHRRVAELLRSC